jgi:hypothetical protein
MIRTAIFSSVVLVTTSFVATVHATPLNYPGAYPPPGGVTTNISGSSPGDAGGASYIFTGFNPGAFSALYWGTYDDNSVVAGLDGTAHALSFSSNAGTSATWLGTTSYTNPANSNTSTVPVEMVITVSGLGADPWVPAAPLGLPSGMGAVVDDSLGADFTANVQFLADVGSGFVALNSISVGGGLANSSVSGGFFSPVSEPSSLLLGLTALLGFPRIVVARVRARNRF